MEIICDIGLDSDIDCIAVGIVHIAAADIAERIAVGDIAGHIVAEGIDRIAAAEGIVHIAADMAAGKDFAVDSSYSVVIVKFV
jgi:hypothetical protein